MARIVVGDNLKYRFDILGLGVTAVDDLFYVDNYPEPDTKIHITKRDRQFGGLTAMALVTGARLGAKCAYAGVLGEDPDSNFIRKTLRDEGINVRHAIKRTGARPVRALAIVDQSTGSRTMFYDTKGVLGADPHSPPDRIVKSARVLIVDRFGMSGMLRASRLARSVGIPVVSDFERTDTPRLGQLLDLVDHLIVSQTFASNLTGITHPMRSVPKLLKRGHEVVVVTCGEKGCWYLAQGESKVKHVPAFQVKAINTTGCGDVFHGAYATGLAEGMGLEKRITFAAAAAALKAAGPAGPTGVPKRSAVETFMRRHGR